MGVPTCLHEVVLEQVFTVLNVVGVGGAQFPGPPVVAQAEGFQQHLVFGIICFELCVAKLLRPHPESHCLNTDLGSVCATICAALRRIVSQ